MTWLAFAAGVAIGWIANSAVRVVRDIRSSRIDTALLSRNGGKIRPVVIRRKQ